VGGLWLIFKPEQGCGTDCRSPPAPEAGSRVTACELVQTLDPGKQKYVPENSQPSELRKSSCRSWLTVSS